MNSTHSLHSQHNQPLQTTRQPRLFKLGSRLPHPSKEEDDSNSDENICYRRSTEPNGDGSDGVVTIVKERVTDDFDGRGEVASERSCNGSAEDDGNGPTF